jgi:protease-4
MAAPGSRPRRLVGRVVGNALIAARDALAWPVAQLVPRDWLVLRLDHGLSDAPPGGLRWLEPAVPRPRCSAHVLEALEAASRDPQLQGVVVRVGLDGIGWGQAVELADAFRKLRGAGKLLVVYAEQTGNAGAWLGGLADRFWMTPEGRLDLVGVRSDGLFLRRVLERLGVRAEILAAGDYKSAGEMLTRDSMSEPAREALREVVDALWQQLVDGLAAGRAGNAERAARWIDGGPYLARQALEAGIVDALVYSDELPRRLVELAGRPVEHDLEPHLRLVNESSYRALRAQRFAFQPLSGPGDQVAVVPLVGMIRRSDAGARGIVGVLRELARDPAVPAVVMRIDSAGGDVLASDLIARAVARLAERKPVVASMGDVAASGGYYVATSAHEILAEPTTLTGSIGVVLAGLDLEELLARLGIARDGLERGQHARIYDFTRRRPADERALLREQVERIYAGFVERVAARRRLSPSDAQAAARGRVWTGRAALERGLVDALGGLDAALARARALAGIDPRSRRTSLRAPSLAPWARWRRADPLDGSPVASSGALFWSPIRIPLE